MTAWSALRQMTMILRRGRSVRTRRAASFHRTRDARNEGWEAMNPLQSYLDRITRRSWLVLAFAVLGLLGAVTFTLWQPTTYTAQSTLSTATENRSPDQDAYLAHGYAQYFNQETYQARIRAVAEVPGGVTVSARTEATSPILYIEAVATDPNVASTVADRVAERFRDEIRGEAEISRAETIATINQQILAKRSLLNQFEGESDERILIIQEIFDLELQVSDLQGNTANQLIDLQSYAGVAANQRSAILNGLLGLAGGLVLGCAVALALAAAKNRLATRQDITDRLGLDTLAVVDADRKGSENVRSQQLKTLASVVSLSELPKPATLAITTSRRTPLGRQIAEGLVFYRALQGTQTVLVRADLSDGPIGQPDCQPSVEGFLAGALADPPAPLKVSVGSAELLVLPAGEPAADPYALFAPARFEALLQHLTGLADLVVIEAPPVNEAAESQIICAAADRTILVIEEDVTTASDGARSCELLTQVGTRLLGAVIGRRVQRKELAAPFSTLPRVDVVPRPESTVPWESQPEREVPSDPRNGAFRS